MDVYDPYTAVEGIRRFLGNHSPGEPSLSSGFRAAERQRPGMVSNPASPSAGTEHGVKRKHPETPKPLN